jgi:uncharacterized membrane protein YciS (DUF1049 family)
MNKKMVERYEHLSGYLCTALGIWFFVGMPLSMVLSGLYFLVGVPLPPLLFFLPSMTYLSGGFLGGLWSGESLRRKALSRTELIGVLFVLGISVGFLLVGVVFAVIGFRRL